MISELKQIIDLGPYAMFALCSIAVIYCTRRLDKCTIYSQELVSGFQDQVNKLQDRFFDFEQRQDDRCLSALEKQSELLGKQNELLVKLEERIP